MLGFEHQCWDTSTLSDACHEYMESKSLFFSEFLLQRVANGLIGNDGNKQAMGHEKPANVLFSIGSQRIRRVDLQLYLEFKPKQMSRDCLDAIFYQNEAKD